jgi:copper resistance protein B
LAAFTALALAAAGAAHAQPVEQLAPADAATRAVQQAQTAMGAMGHHQRTHTFLQTEVDYGRADDADQFTWDALGWIGGDRNKLWFKSEGEREGGDTEAAEVQLLYSRNIATFFDAQIGIRQDFEPSSTTYLAAGVQGLAPYLLETDLTGFLSQDGDFSLRLEQSLDLLLTQRLILEPYLEAELQIQDAPERRLGAGLSEAEAGLQLRYEITRKFAPYVDAVYERSFGETARLRGQEDEPGAWILRVGLRSWF